MRMPPDGGNLLRTAHQVFVHEVLDSIPGKHRYSALMIARAMGIALREHEIGECEENVELDLFVTLYGKTVVERAGTDRGSRLYALNRRLAKEIRDGSMDATYSGALRECLFEQVRAKLRLSNPKYLQGDE